MTKKKNPHWGTTLDEFLTEDGIREAAPRAFNRPGLDTIALDLEKSLRRG